MKQSQSQGVVDLPCFFIYIMAQGKKSFILYADLLEVVKEMPKEDAGELFEHILKYVNDQNPETINPLVKLAFIPIKQQLKRDLRKYEDYIEKQKVNGAKGGRPKKTQKTQAFISKPKKADTVNDNDTDINNYIVEISKSDDYLNNFYRRYKLEKGAASKLLEEFKQHLAMNPTEHPHFSDFRKHFNNWMNVQDSNKKLEPYKKQKSGALW